jgi:hypothetical protein
MLRIFKPIAVDRTSNRLQTVETKPALETLNTLLN